MHQNNEANQMSPEQVRRGRRMAILLFAIGFGPMILATVMYYTGWLNPAGHSNHGALIQPPVPVSELKFRSADDTLLADRFGPELKNPEWMMIVVAENCADACEELLYRARQVNIALGKNANRVNRASWLGAVSEDLSERLSKEYESMERLNLAAGDKPAWAAGISPEDQPRILLVDPFGNVIMHYGSEHTGKEMLKDLKQLLKLSQIG